MIIIELQNEIVKPTIMVGDFNIPLSTTDRTDKKISEKWKT